MNRQVEPLLLCLSFVLGLHIPCLLSTCQATILPFGAEENLPDLGGVPALSLRHALCFLLMFFFPMVLDNSGAVCFVERKEGRQQAVLTLTLNKQLFSETFGRLGRHPIHSQVVIQAFPKFPVSQPTQLGLFWEGGQWW